MKADVEPRLGLHTVSVGLLGLSSMAIFGLTWQLVVVGCIVELMRLAPRLGSMVPTFGAAVLALFMASHVFLAPDAGADHLALAILGMGSYFIAYTVSCEGWVRVRAVMLVVVAGSALHGVLNLSLILRDYGPLPSTRAFSDVWTGQLWVATGQATVWAPLAGAVPFLLFGQRSRRGRALGWVSLALCLWAAAVLASRTLIALTAISFLLGAILVIVRRGRIGRAAGVGGLMALTSVIVAGVAPSSILQRLPLIDRLNSGQTSVVNDPRTERWAYYIDNMWQWQGGGRRLEQSVGYAHNLWLDTFDADGAIPFLLLTMFTATFVFSLVRLFRSPRASPEQVLLVLGVGVTWLAQASTEPLIDLTPYLFAAGCAFAGSTSGLLRSLKNGVPRATRNYGALGTGPRLESV